jgi:hypothetical protein
VGAVLAGKIAAHDIITTKLTYTRDISRVFARRCVSCHSAGSSIPLTNYEEVRPWAVAIKEQVLSRSMPPWGAVKGFGHLMPDSALTQQETLIIAVWVVGGAPRGDLALLPKALKVAAMPAEEPLRDAASIETRTVLERPLSVSGLRPLSDTSVESARIIARLPNGRIEPLVWLYHFSPQGNRVFRFREPLKLPEKTVIESSAPLRFALEVKGTNATAQRSGIR